MYQKRLCGVFCSVAGAALPGTGFSRPFPCSWGSGRAQLWCCQPAEQLKAWPLSTLFSHLCPSPLPSAGLVQNGVQRSGAWPPSLHSRKNALPDACWQPGCLTQHGTAGAGPGWCQPPGLWLPLCRRASSRGGVLAPRGLYRSSCASIKAQGGGWRGLEIRRQTQHPWRGAGGPRPPSLLKQHGPLGRHCLLMEKTTVLITGCSSGIGLGLAARLAADSARRFKGKGVTLRRGGGPAPLGVSRAGPGSTSSRTAGAWGWAGAGAGRAAWQYDCPAFSPSIRHHA